MTEDELLNLYDNLFYWFRDFKPADVRAGIHSAFKGTKATGQAQVVAGMVKSFEIKERKKTELKFYGFQ